MKTITEPAKKVPVTLDVDVAVVGAGIAGLLAALSAARQGARTLLIDRFGMPGGNIGPGFIVAGSLTGWPGRSLEHPDAYLPREFMEAHGGAGGTAMPPFSNTHQLRDANVASYVAFKMLKDANVELMLSAYAADPIMQDNRVTGMFFENKSGRQAATAKVVIDATGEADVARRAGAPIIYPDPKGKSVGRSMGICFIAGGVDWQAYEASGDYDARQKRFAAVADEAAATGGFNYIREVPGLGNIRTFQYQLCGVKSEGLACGYAGVDWPDNINQGDGSHIATMEVAMRTLCFETVKFWRDNVPGFENAYLMLVPPYLGSRGGPAIDGEFTMTAEVYENERLYDDVIFRFGRQKRKASAAIDIDDRAVQIAPAAKEGDKGAAGADDDRAASRARAARAAAQRANYAVEPTRADVPYRIMLPKKIDGLLAAGRSASTNPTSLMRSRLTVMHMGTAAGIAGALAAAGGVTPREVDIKELQVLLLDAGFYLGNHKRLVDLRLR